MLGFEFEGKEFHSALSQNVLQVTCSTCITCVQRTPGLDAEHIFSQLRWAGQVSGEMRAYIVCTPFAGSRSGR